MPWLFEEAHSHSLVSVKASRVWRNLWLGKSYQTKIKHVPTQSVHYKLGGFYCLLLVDLSITSSRTVEQGSPWKGLSICLTKALKQKLKKPIQTNTPCFSIHHSGKKSPPTWHCTAADRFSWKTSWWGRDLNNAWSRCGRTCSEQVLVTRSSAGWFPDFFAGEIL